MRIIKVEEWVRIIKCYEFAVPDTISDEKFCDLVENNKEAIYDIDIDNSNVNFECSDYIYATEDHLPNTRIDIYDENDNLIKRTC